VRACRERRDPASIAILVDRRGALRFDASQEPMIRTRILSCGLAALALVWSAPTLAQESPPAITVPSAPAAAPSAAPVTSAAAPTPGPAPAGPSGTPPTADSAAPATTKPAKPLRDGVVLGASLGFGLASASGYPNDVRLNQNPDYYGSTPMLPGYSFSFMFLGALTPYLNVGVWGGGATFENSDWKSVGGGGGLRVEGFPLMAFCSCVMPPILANYLGVYGQVGAGSVSTRVKREGNYETVGGVQSFLAAGAFYEVKLGKMFAIGPDLRYELIASRTSDRSSLILGARVAFYPAN
jgi:hypothetical protein